MKKSVLQFTGVGLLLASVGLFAGGAISGSGSIGEAKPKLQFEVPPYVMRCGYKVYKDPTVLNGRYWVAKAMLKNEGEASLTDVEIACRIPGLTDWEFPKKTPEVLPGQTLMHCYYPDFDDSIVEQTTRDREVVEVRIRYSEKKGGEQKEELRQLPFTLLGRNQLAYTDIPESEMINQADYYSNTFFDACFVTPNDPIIRYFTQRIQKRMGGSSANSGDPEEIEKFIKAAYDTVADCGVRYGGTTGLPMQSGGVSTLVQEVRLPREVITGSAGLCIELSNLFASIFASEGLEPVLFFTNNHAWPGVRLPNGNLFGIESTMVGQGDFESAKSAGFLNTAAFLSGGQFQMQDDQGNTKVHTVVPMQLLDIASVQGQGIRPIELPDSADLRARIDTLFEKMDQATQRPVYQEQPNRNHEEIVENVLPEPVVAEGAFQSTLGLSVQVPAGWSLFQSPLAAIPALELSANTEADGSGFGIEVYSFPGVPNCQKAMGQLSRAANPMGMVFQYQDGGAVNGTNFQQIQGNTYQDGVCIAEWIGYFRSGNGGLTGVIFHSPPGDLSYYSNQITQISNSIR